MPSHYSSIGFHFASARELAEFTTRVVDDAQEIATAQGTYLRWTSASGAELWFQADTDNEFIGAHPHYAGNHTLRIRTQAAIHSPDDTALDGAFHAWANPHDQDEGDYPFVFDCTNFYEYAQVPLPANGVVQLAAFAHGLSFYESEEAYSASQEREIKFASRSLIPSGLFGEQGQPPTAHVIFTGHVLAAERKVNEAMGQEFLWAAVDTLGGVYDVVADPSLLDDVPAVGGILHGTFWLSGHVRELTSEGGAFRKFLHRLRKP